jgi:sulfur carrier protein
MSATVGITANGIRVTVPQGMSLLDFLKGRGIDPSVVVAEINRAIVRREEFGGTLFRENDTVEIMRFVGGG